MPDIRQLVSKMKNSSKNVRFSDALSVAQHYFGPPRVHGSHYVFRMPWHDDPRVNIQNRDGYVAPYQIKQLLKAIDRMESEK